MVIKKKIHISFFGGFRILQNGADIFLRNKKARELLAYLAIAQSGKTVKKSLSAVLWPDTEEPEKAMDSLYKVIGWIKKTFDGSGETPLINRPSYLCLNDETVSSDTAEFLRLYQSGDIASLVTAEKLYAGIMLSDCDYEWFADSIGFYETCYADVLETLIRHCRGSGDIGRARVYEMKGNLFFGEGEF